MIIDDYDKLIQIADLMSSGANIVKIDERLYKLSIKYNIREELLLNKIKEANLLKAYFDEKCGCNIYDLFSL